jgi:type I restriction enzyme S subunit
LKRVLIPVPSKHEQRAIAEALSDVDGLLGALEVLIAKKRAIKQAAMQQLLTGKTRLPGFSGPWETAKLGDIGEISGAGVDKKIRPSEPLVRLVNYLDVYHKPFLRGEDLAHVVSAKPAQARRCGVEKGDVFFTPTSEVPDDIGRSAVALQDIVDGVYSYHLVRLRMNVDWDLNFRAYVFNTKSFLDQASRASEGSGTRYVVTLPRFRSLTVFHPSDLGEQAAIGGVLSDMDAEITALEHRRDKARAIKQGMMQQLLTGRVRLITPDQRESNG